MTAISIAPEREIRPDEAEQAIGVAAARFWAHVDRQEDGCWRWLATDRVANFSRRRYHSARIAWELSGYGDLTAVHLDRTCDTEACVRPDHHCAWPHRQGKGTGRPPVGVLASVRQRLALQAELDEREARAATTVPGLHVAATPAPLTVPLGAAATASALLRGPDTEAVTFLNRAGTLVRVFPGGATVITPAGEYHDPDLRRAVHKAMAAEGRAAA